MASGSSGEELCEYVNVKSYRISEEAQESEQAAGATGKIFKHWTNLWVVLHIEKSPSYCFIGHCKKEGDWLIDNKIEKIHLGETFQVERLPAGYSKKYNHIVQVTLKSYRMDLAFDSMTKMECWYKALQGVTDCHHVDLVRCPEHSELEGEYIIEVGSVSFKAWSLGPVKDNQVKWEWLLKHIRRVHWHKNVQKLEVEPGRSSQTGEGHFYFTGQHASRLFSTLRHMMTSHPRVTTPTSSTPSTPLTSPTPSTRRESNQSALSQSVHVNSQMYSRFEKVGGLESEDDWTGGTGDSWTGTSDSGFVFGMRPPITSRPHDGAHFILPSGPAPPVPNRGPRSEASSHYTDLNIHTLEPDNQYVQITRRDNGHVYDTVPSEDQATTPPARTHYHVPRPHIKASNSQNCLLKLSTLATDDYCQMSPALVNRDIRRNGSLPMERPPPVPPHQRGGVSSVAWTDRRASNQSESSGT